jgi:hypothetical protein
VSEVYLYALVGERPAEEPGVGLGGEPLRLVPCGDVVAVVGDVERRPSLDPDAMRGHDAVVQRLAGLVEAILPARFGATSGEAELAQAVAARAPALRDALALVRGREQMTLRVYGTAGPPPAAPPAPPADPAQGPGARYLARRRERARAARSLPEIEPVSRAVAPGVHATRIRRHATPPLLATVYHLVERGQAPAYRARVEAARPELRGDLRVVISGPWPPYAFAPVDAP